jgi:hypothetical protein
MEEIWKEYGEQFNKLAIIFWWLMAKKELLNDYWDGRLG